MSEQTKQEPKRVIDADKLLERIGRDKTWYKQNRRDHYGSGRTDALDAVIGMIYALMEDGE